MLKIKDIEINGYAALAPMAGTADLSMRKLCEEYGSAYTVAEMVSARGLICGSEKSDKLMDCTGQTGVFGVQLCTSYPEDIERAVEMAMVHNPAFIDINMGCPAPKVSSNGGGSGLMRNLPLAEKIVEETVKHSPVPVTVKMRKGWDENSVNCIELAKICEATGASAITLHGRTRKQMYAPSVDIDIIKKMKEAINIPLIANGDVCTPEDCKKMYEITNCDMVLVGRAALGKPWLFSQINEFFKTGTYSTPSLEERLAIMRKQIADMVALKGDYVGFREARKHCSWYMTDIRGARLMRAKCGAIESMDDVDRIIEELLKIATQED